MLSQFSYVRASSLQDAVKHLALQGSRVHAGGTDLLGCLRDEVFEADTLVSISRLDTLRGIKETLDGGLRIGSLTTVTDVANSTLVRERYPGLAQAAHQVASPQLRNQGTVGGNICQKPRCWYYRGEFHCLRKGGDTCFALVGENQYHCIFGSDNKCCIVHPSDMAPVLVALGAEAKISGHKGDRVVPMGKFYVLPADSVEKETVIESGEIVTDIMLPKAPQGLRSSYRKVRARRAWDFALAGAALAILFEGGKVKGARVVLSGAAPIPWRAVEVEEVITGQRLDAKTITKAAEASMKKAEPLEHNGYKIPLFKGLLEEQLTELAKT